MSTPEVDARARRSRGRAARLGALVLVVLLAGAALLLWLVPESGGSRDPVGSAEASGDTDVASIDPISARDMPSSEPLARTAFEPLARKALQTESLPRGPEITARIRHADGSTPSEDSILAWWRAGSGVGINLGTAVADAEGLWRWPVDSGWDEAQGVLTLRIDGSSPFAFNLVAAASTHELLEVRLPERFALHGTLDDGGTLEPGEEALLHLTWRASGGFRAEQHLPISAGAYAFPLRPMGTLTSAAFVTRRGVDSVVIPLRSELPNLEAGGGDVRWDIRVCPEPLDLTVRVLDGASARPVPGARVTVGGMLHGATGADGTAYFAYAPALMDALVTVEHSDFIAQEAVPFRRSERAAANAQGFQDAQDAREVVVELHAGITLSGWVQDARGAPIAEALVSCRGSEGWSELAGDPTDARGWFAIDNVRPGGQRLLVITGRSGLRSDFLLDVTPGMPPQSWTLLPAARLAGRVLRADRTPCAGTDVIAVLQDGMRETESVVTDSEGKFADLELTVGGDYFLYAADTAEGAGAGALAVRIWAGEERQVEIVVAPEPVEPPPIELRLEVTEAGSGRPVLAALVISRKPWPFRADTEPLKDQPYAAPGCTVRFPRGLVELQLVDSSGTYAPGQMLLDTAARSEGDVVRVALHALR